ncbi:MAG: 30S ribosomal protein S11 [Patescibacteria group bacterium]
MSDQTSQLFGDLGVESAPIEKVEKKEGSGVKKKSKKKVYRSIPVGAVHIKATFNNTIVTVTDAHGNVLGWASAGGCGFRGPKKATPYAASVIVKQVMERVKPYGLTDASVFVKGVGSGREAAVRALNANGINVIALKDVTPIPHNGCRAPRVRRV